MLSQRSCDPVLAAQEINRKQLGRNGEGDVFHFQRDTMELRNESYLEVESTPESDNSFSLLDNLASLQLPYQFKSTVLVTAPCQATQQKATRKNVKVKKATQPQPETSQCTQFAARSTYPNSLPESREKRKLNLNKRNSLGETKLHNACKRQKLDEVKELIAQNIDVNIEDNAGWTALHEAASMGNHPIVKELVNAGASVNCRNHDGITPLQDAVCANSYQVVAYLLENGADRDDQNGNGLTAVDLATDESLKNLLSTFKHAPIQETSHVTAAQAQPPVATPVQPEQSDGRAKTLHPINAQSSPFVITDHASLIAVAKQKLEKVRMKQIEMEFWNPATQQDAAQFLAVLNEIEGALSDMQHKQQMEKIRLSIRYQTVPDKLRRRVLRSQFISLLSVQRSLIEHLETHIEIAKAYVDLKTRLSSRCPDQRAFSFHRGRNGSHNTAPTHSGPQGHQASSCQRMEPLEQTQSLLSFTVKKNQIIIRTNEGAKEKYLHQLIYSRLLPPQSTLQLDWKGKHYYATLQEDGSLLSNGKLYNNTEHWMEFIFDKTFQLNLTYTLDKVEKGNTPLSHYLVRYTGIQKVSPTCSGDKGSTPVQQSEESAGQLDILKRIKNIRLVNDNELLPHAVVDSFWNTVINQNSTELANWGSEL